MMDMWYGQQMPLKIDFHNARLGDFKWKKMSVFKRNFGNFNDTLYQFGTRWRPVPKKAEGKRKRKAPEPEAPKPKDGAEKAGGKRKAPEPTGMATAEGERKVPEPDSEPEVEAERPSKKQMVNEDVIDFRPWQKDTVDFIFDPERNERHILWVYGPKNMGKSYLKDHLLNEYGAKLLTADGTARDLTCLVADALDGPVTIHNKKFRDNPILLVDIPLANEEIIRKKGLYMSLETMLGSFCSTKYKPRNVTYGGKKVAIVVLSNILPSVKHLSTDRLQVHKINDQTFEMRKDLDFDAKIKQQEREQEKLDREREAAIDRAEAGLAEEESPAPVDLTKYFEPGPDQCYKLSNAPTGKIWAKDQMLEALKRKGYHCGNVKEMNAWIRKTYAIEKKHATEKNTMLSKTHPHVMEKLPSNRIAFYGFVRV